MNDVPYEFCAQLAANLSPSGVRSLSQVYSSWSPALQSYDDKRVDVVFVIKDGAKRNTWLYAFRGRQRQYNFKELRQLDQRFLRISSINVVWKDFNMQTNWNPLANAAEAARLITFVISQLASSGKRIFFINNISFPFLTTIVSSNHLFRVIDQTFVGPISEEFVKRNLGYATSVILGGKWPKSLQEPIERYVLSSQCREFSLKVMHSPEIRFELDFFKKFFAKLKTESIQEVFVCGRMAFRADD